MKRTASVAVGLTAVVAMGTAASASWGSHSSGAATARSTTLPTGPTPAAPTTGTQSSANVTVTWPAATYVGISNEVASYTITRFKGGVADTIGGTCTGTIAAPTHTCVDTVSTNGSYSYKITAKSGSWTGTPGTASGTVTVTLVAPPAAPNSVSLQNGGGTGSAFINSANASALQVRTALPAGAQAGDQVVLTITDAGLAHTVTATSAALAAGGAQNVDQTVNLSTLSDGTVTISAKVTNAAGTSSSVSRTNTKDVVGPQNLTIGNSPSVNANSHKATFSGTGGRASGDVLNVTVIVCATNAFPCASPLDSVSGTVGGSGSVSGPWTSSQTTGLEAGTRWAQATQADAAGNASTTTPFSFAS